MMLPAVLLLGFLLLTALVIAMGTRSTARYEQELRAEQSAGEPNIVADQVGRNTIADQVGRNTIADQVGAVAA